MEEAEKELEAIAAGEDPVAGKKKIQQSEKFIILFSIDNSIVKFILYALCWPKILDTIIVAFEIPF